MTNTPPKRLGKGLRGLLNVPVSVDVPGEEPIRREGSGGEAASSAGLAGRAEAQPGRRVVDVPVGEIAPGPYQPRRVFDETALSQLAASIRTAGVMQPVLVRARRGGSGAGFELVSGERRWRAAKIAGLTAVPAIVAELSDEQAAEWALIENVQREDLSVMERARALKGLSDRFGLGHAELADKLGMDRSSVTNLIRLNELEESIVKYIERGTLTAGHGKALLMVPFSSARVELAERAAGQGWSVRKLEFVAAKAVLSVKPAKGTTGEVGELEEARRRRLVREDIEKRMSEHLGTKVAIKTNERGTKGKIVIEFYDLDQFEGVMGSMGMR